MNVLSLCSGDGRLDLGVRLVRPDARVVAFVEANRPSRALLIRSMRFLGGPAALAADIRTHDARPYRGAVDGITAGWPCKGFSTASRGRPTHPNLWPFVRRQIVQSRPRWVFLENVNSAPWDVVESQLRRLGFDTARCCACPSDFGAPHRRPRTFLLADADRQGEPLGAFDAEVAGLRPPPVDGFGAFRRALRVDDGLPGRMESFRIIGDGVVPLVAGFAFGTLAMALRGEATHED